jgi:bifunctional non-homologous end joining protein LigD
MKAKFIDVMLLLRTDRLPGGQEWLYEIKLDGYRALAIKTSGKLQLRSRNDNDFTQRYPSIAAGLQKMPDETVIDGKIVASMSKAIRHLICCRTTDHPRRR